MISYSPDVIPYYKLGTEATYTCEAGFYINITEANQVRRCMDDNGMDAIGGWSGQEPSCVRKLSAKVCNYTLVLYKPKDVYIFLLQ